VKAAAFAAALAALALAPARAEAFCGFYVNGAGSEMFAEATQVVLMREGTRTVLSMQNAYKGPVEEFALVVPVPVVLQEADVKTLPKEVFAKVDGMGAPRLVEYWERDPCAQTGDGYGVGRGMSGAPKTAKDSAAADPSAKVVIEAQFVVGEYEIVILSATDSTALDAWLRDGGYKIPAGAEPLLRPYVEQGSKFFVAKVDPTKVTFDADGRAQLSPLRFHYDADELMLPIRLGLANSAGTQDLIINIVSPEGRYQVANRPNVTIPTNLDVKDEVRDRFGEFYAALFDRTVEMNPGAVVTEYAWDASTCDPCPGPALAPNDFAALGADVLPGGGAAPTSGRGGSGRVRRGGFVLTRLHARYGKHEVADDLVFAKAEPIVGGREHVVDPQTRKLEERATPSRVNNFQGRYAIRHEWTGPIECERPVRGVWGGPPKGERYAGPQAGRDLAFVPRGASLPQMVVADVPEIGIKAGGVVRAAPDGASRGSPGDEPLGRRKAGDVDSKGKPGCGCAAGGDAAGGLAALAILGALVSRRRRRTTKGDAS
jgi:MYXO-CTERM domain-containing protein